MSEQQPGTRPDQGDAKDQAPGQGQGQARGEPVADARVAAERRAAGEEESAAERETTTTEPPAAARREVSEPEVSEREAPEPKAPEQGAAEPAAAPRPEVSEREVSGPEVSGPAVSEAQAVAEAAQAAVEQLEDRWRRALADLDNLRKRCARELVREREAERARVAAAWLPVVDGLERALAHADADPAALIEGVRVVHEQAVGVLASLGYRRYDQIGVPFDPVKHEALGVVDTTDKAPGTVVEVVRPGYGDGESQLRPAGVKVARPRE